MPLLTTLINPDGTLKVAEIGTNFKEALMKAYSRSFCSHSAIQGFLQTYMQSLGWQKIKNPGYTFINRVDAVYGKGEVKILVEIKPRTAKVEEIEKGIGQTVLYLVHGQYAMLVCSNFWEEFIIPVFQKLNCPRLLLLTYDENGVWKVPEYGRGGLSQVA